MSVQKAEWARHQQDMDTFNHLQQGDNEPNGHALNRTWTQSKATWARSYILDQKLANRTGARRQQLESKATLLQSKPKWKNDPTSVVALLFAPVSGLCRDKSLRHQHLQVRPGKVCSPQVAYLELKRVAEGMECLKMAAEML